MFGLVVTKPLADFIQSLQPSGWWSYVISSATLSGLLAGIPTYVFVRILDVVRGDYDLVELQSSFMVRMVERREAKKFAEAHDETTVGKPTPPKDYGKIVQ